MAFEGSCSYDVKTTRATRRRWLLELLESRCWEWWGEGWPDTGKLKIPLQPKVPGLLPPREHRSVPALDFQIHDKTVGKLIVLQDIKHQTPLILSERDARRIQSGGSELPRGVFPCSPRPHWVPPSTASPGCGYQRLSSRPSCPQGPPAPRPSDSLCGGG